MDLFLGILVGIGFGICIIGIWKSVGKEREYPMF